MNHPNPNDAAVTYNEDGTINIYLYTNFKSSDPEVFYSVTYINFETGKEYVVEYNGLIAYIENIPSGSYGVTYTTYVKTNDIKYVLDIVVPSGGIEATTNAYVNGYANADNDGRITDIQINFSMYVFDEDSFILTIDGIEYNIDPKSITYNEEYYQYEISYSVNETPSSVSLTFNGRYEYGDYDSIKSVMELKGQEYKTIYIEIL